MRLYEGGGEVTRLEVEAGDLELAGVGILTQARTADALASSVAAVPTGCIPLDEALVGWVNAWGTQLAILGLERLAGDHAGCRRERVLRDRWIDRGGVRLTPVDPLEGLVLPAGDPDSISLQVIRIMAWLEAVTGCGHGQKLALDAVTQNDWKGLAANGARTGSERVTGAYERASTDLDRVGRVLRACGSDWTLAQEQYRLARQLADEAMMEEAASCTVSGRPPGDSNHRHQARALAAEAIERFDRATRRAVSTIDEIATDINRAPGFIARPGHSWYQDPLQWGSDGWHMATAATGATVRAAGYILTNPPQLGRMLNDAMQMMGGLALMTGSSAGFGGGLVLDMTGIGLPVGIPLDVLSAAGVAGGAGLTAHGALDALRELGHSYSVSSGGGGGEGGSLEGRVNYPVRDPKTGDEITDIDEFRNGILWEVKTAAAAPDSQIWIQDQIIDKFKAYLRCRPLLAGYEDAPIGFDFRTSNVYPPFREAVEAAIEELRGEYPSVRIYLRWSA